MYTIYLILTKNNGEKVELPFNESMNENYFKQLRESNEYEDFHIEVDESDELESMLNHLLKENTEQFIIHDFINVLERFNGEDIEAVLDFFTYLDERLEDFNLDKFRECYVGYFHSVADFGEAMMKEIYNLPSYLEMYFDYKKYGEDLLECYDYIQIGNNYFVGY